MNHHPFIIQQLNIHVNLVLEIYAPLDGLTVTGAGTSNLGAGVASALWASSDEAGWVGASRTAAPCDPKSKAVDSFYPVELDDSEPEASSEPYTHLEPREDLDGAPVSVHCS